MENKKVLINKYEIIKELGRGGMAIVYLAVDKQLKREVAVKMLHPHMNESEHIIRFEREAVVLATLSHTNIVNIYEFFEFEGNYYIIYEYVNGETLGNFLEYHRIRYPIISLMIAYEIIEAIEYIHKNGVIHRDIKPDNIMISRNGTVKVMDFGIAKVLSNTTVTDAGSLLGSPAYMSPEQVMGEEITFKSDIFSIGVLIYKLITNVSPFASSSTASTLKNVLNSSYPRISHPLVDKGMERIIEFCLNKDPKKRINDLTALKLIIKEKIANEGKEPPFKEELSVFFKNPDVYQINLKQNLLEHYKKYSYQLYKQKNILKSLNYCGKALELAPKDPQLRVLSNKLKIFNNGKRLRIIISFFIILTLMLILFFNIIFIKQSKISYQYKLNTFDYTYLSLISKNKFLNKFLDYDNSYLQQIINNPKNIIEINTKFNDKKIKVNTKDKLINYSSINKNKNKRVNPISINNTKNKMLTSTAINKNKNKSLIIKKVAITPKKIKYGELQYCFRPYAKVIIDDKIYSNSCITNKIKIPYGKHKIIAKYPYSNDYKGIITIDDKHKNTKIRYNFNHNSKIYLNLKSVASIIVSLKNEYGKYININTLNGKRVLFKNRKLREVKYFFVKPGRYYMDITNGDLYYNNLLLDITQKRNYIINMDLENDKNIKIQ